MSMQERFSDEEWRMLIGIPPQLLMMVGMADGKFDPREREKANRCLTRAAIADPDPLYRELAASMYRLDTSLEADMARADPPRCRQILQDNLSQEEYQGFLRSVLADAISVAGASRKGRRGRFRAKGDAVGVEAKALMVAWATFYGLRGD